jgi:hypothetical protein
MPRTTSAMRALLASAIATAIPMAVKAAAVLLRKASAVLADAEAAGTARRSQPTRFEECTTASLIKEALEATPYDHDSRDAVQDAFNKAWAIITA